MTKQDAVGNVMNQAIRDVLDERQRQQSVEGWTPEHDDQYHNGELPQAAACYSLNAINPAGHSTRPPSGWPWSADWWKPKGPRRDLVRAAALIVAEIERLDRMEARRG